MALTACRECGQQVSTEAATCPHCGVAQPAPGPAPFSAPIAPAPSSGNNVWWILMVVVVLAVIGVAMAPSILRAMGRSTITGGKTDAVVGVTAPDGVCWTANIGGATKDGCGSNAYQVHDSLGLFSSTVQKKDGGSESVSIGIEIDGQSVASNSTSAPYGVAVVIVGR